jgi:hypothetical protein
MPVGGDIVCLLARSRTSRNIFSNTSDEGLMRYAEVLDLTLSLRTVLREQWFCSSVLCVS